MKPCVRLPVDSGKINESFRKFFEGLLEKQIVQAVFVPIRQPDGQMVMSSLVRKPEKLKNLDPLAPVTSTSAARLLSLLTYKQPGFRMAFLTFHDFGGYSYVFQPPVSAGADKYLLDFCSLKLSGWSGIIYGVGLGYHRLKIGYIDIDGLLIVGIGIREERLVVVASPLGG